MCCCPGRFVILHKLNNPDAGIWKMFPLFPLCVWGRTSGKPVLRITWTSSRPTYSVIFLTRPCVGIYIVLFQPSCQNWVSKKTTTTNQSTRPRAHDLPAWWWPCPKCPLSWFEKLASWLTKERVMARCSEWFYWCQPSDTSSFTVWHVTGLSVLIYSYLLSTYHVLLAWLTI